ncbi:MAG: DUF6531 domain-containing protein, partial [Gammaproteobacteria bacterium]
MKIENRTLAAVGARMLALCGALSAMLALQVGVAEAAGTAEWTARILKHSPSMPGGDATYYASGVFPTRKAAEEALKQIDTGQNWNANPDTIVLMKQNLRDRGLVGASATRATYQYAAPPASPSVPEFQIYTWNYGSVNGPFYPDEASAVAAKTTQDTCYRDAAGNYHSPVWLTAESGWVPNGVVTPAGLEDKIYRPHRQDFSAGCATVDLKVLSLSRTREISCPSAYLLTQYQVGVRVCENYFTGYVEGPLAECPQNGSVSTRVGDPCDVSTGDFTETEVDYSVGDLQVSRNYHSATLEASHNLGTGWSHIYGATLAISAFVPGAPAGFSRPNGHHEAIATIGGAMMGLSGSGIHLQASGTQWVASLTDGRKEVYDTTGRLIQQIATAGQITALAYDAAGRLASVTGPFGHALLFAYDSSDRQSAVTVPGGGVIAYAYDSSNNLISVTYPDGTSRQYLYENPALPNHLTGIVDEVGNRFLTVQYNASGAVVSSHQAGGAGAVSIAYGATTATVTDALGLVSTYSFTSEPNYAPRLTRLSRGTLSQSFTVPAGATDKQRRVTQVTDAAGNVTKFNYDNNHLTSKTEAFGTPSARTTVYSYLGTNSSLLASVGTPLSVTTLAYFPGTQNVQTRTITDAATTPAPSPRTWSYAYDSAGRVLTVDGPRTDVSDITTYTYYACSTGAECGQVHTVTDAAANVTTYLTYNAHGQPLSFSDPNGVITTLTYDLRQRQRSQTAASETTSYTYWPTGLLRRITLPNLNYLEYTYDQAHRLKEIGDALGNKIVYTLDAIGNRTSETTYDAGGVLRTTRSRIINVLNQVYQEIAAAGTAAVTTEFAYDNNGNNTRVNAPLGRVTSSAFDALDRLSQLTDAANGLTRFGYDASNNLTSVTDPRNLVTTYQYNGLGDQRQVTSPDSGVTSKTHDPAGNVLTSTDARGALATYRYDSLNRVTSIAYSMGGVTDQTTTYSYDVGSNSRGRLTSASDANSSLVLTYDLLGRVVTASQAIGSLSLVTGYAYSNGNRTGLTTPAGRQIGYSYDTLGRVSGISLNGITVLSGVTREPFGDVNAWVWGNGAATVRNYNADGKVSQISSSTARSLSYDEAWRIVGINDSGAPALSWGYSYDVLDRITGAASSTQSQSFTYDANGNRRTQGGSSPQALAIATASNRLTGLSGSLVRSYGYD